MKIPVEHIYLSNMDGKHTADLPLTLQMKLKSAITTAIWRRVFAPEDKLPSSRALADHLHISRVTVSIVYQELMAEGYIVNRPRSGSFVAKDAPMTGFVPPQSSYIPNGLEEESPLNWQSRLKANYVGHGTILKPKGWRNYRYPFIFGQADLGLFTLSAWRACANQALSRRDLPFVLGDFGIEDDPMLIEEMIARTLPARHISAKPDEILITLGAQNSLWLVSNLLFADYDNPKVAIETPGYPELWEILRFAGAKIIPIPVDEHGILVDKIPNDIMACFVTPGHQTPTGVAMSRDRRNQLRQHAKEHDYIIIEDDYDFEVRYSNSHPPALKSQDRSGRIIYIGSFSKSLFPGLRLGFLIGPSAFIQRAKAIRTLVARHPPGLTQRITAYFLNLGHYNAHEHLLRKTYATRRNITLSSLQSQGLRVKNTPIGSGASLWVECPPHINTKQLYQKLEKQGVLIEPGTPFFYRPLEEGGSENIPQNFIRLAYSAIDTDLIEEGVKRIGEAVRTYKNE